MHTGGVDCQPVMGDRRRPSVCNVRPQTIRKRESERERESAGQRYTITEERRRFVVVALA